MKTNKDCAFDTELKIKGDYILAMRDFSEFMKSVSRTGSIEERTDDIRNMDDRDTMDTDLVDLDNVMTVVSMMHKNNKRMEKELHFLKKGQLLSQQKLQAIQDSHKEIILSKDAKYDMLVRKLIDLTEIVTKATWDVVNLSKSENENKKKLDYEFDRIQERDHSVSMRLIDLNLLILKSMEKQNADYNRLEKYLEFSMKLGIKNSTDNVNCDAKIEKLLEKTVAVGVSQKNALIDAKRIVAEEIYSLKSKSTMVECRCNKKENHINTDIKNIKLVIEKDLNNMEDALRDIKKNRKLQNGKADQHNRKYEQLKMRLFTFEKDLQNKSEQFTQNKLMMSNSYLRGRNYQPNDVHETEVKSASISPRAQPNTSPSPSCLMPPTAPPPPPPSARHQEQKYSNYVIIDDLSNDMHKQLRKSSEEIEKIPEYTDNSIPCRPVVILPEQGSKPLPPLSASQLTPPASPFSSPAPLSTPPAPLSPSTAPSFPQSPQFETTSG